MTLVALKPEQRLINLVGALGGRWNGYTAMCRCPIHADKTPSLSLRQGQTSILVHCFAGCDPDEVLRELARIRPGQRFEPPAISHPARTPDIDRLWTEGIPIEGTLAERYLRRRGLPLDLADLRFHPRCPRGPKPHTQFLPALLVAVRDSRNLCALQRIFLDLDDRRIYRENDDRHAPRGQLARHAGDRHVGTRRRLRDRSGVQPPPRHPVLVATQRLAARPHRIPGHRADAHHRRGQRL